MKRILINTLLALTGMFVLEGCHEGDPIPYVDDCFDDNYNADVPFTLVVNEGMDEAFTVKARGGEPEMARRFTIWAYRNGSGTPTFTFSTLSETPTFKLPIGDYEFKVFCDYVNKAEPKDLFYFTDRVEELLMFNKASYDANTHYKHSFWGDAAAKIVYKNQPVRVELSSLMARIQFRATDLPEGYKPAKVRVTYLDKVPSAVDGYTSGISYEWENVAYVHAINDGFISFDYVFADDADRKLRLMVEILDAEDKVRARVQEIYVPIKRKGITTVEGPFFNKQDDAPKPPVPGGGGIGIDTGFTSTVVVEV